MASLSPGIEDVKTALWDSMDERPHSTLWRLAAAGAVVGGLILTAPYVVKMGIDLVGVVGDKLGDAASDFLNSQVPAPDLGPMYDPNAGVRAILPNEVS